MSAPTPAPLTVTLSSCARAATAEETRYRIDVPIAPARGARIVALDRDALAVVERVAARSWANSRFFVCDDSPGGDPDEVSLRGIGGTPAVLAEQLADADVVVLIATEDGGIPGGAAAIGKACAERGIMTAGLVIGNGYRHGAALAALRPHARVLLPSADENDVIELLTALRA
jgi:hypothetical protein